MGLVSVLFRVVGFAISSLQLRLFVLNFKSYFISEFLILIHNIIAVFIKYNSLPLRSSLKSSFHTSKIDLVTKETG